MVNYTGGLSTVVKTASKPSGGQMGRFLVRPQSLECNTLSQGVRRQDQVGR